MTSFRRLVMGIVEAMAVLSIFFGTFVGAIYGAASGAVWSGIFGIAPNVDIRLQGIGQVASRVRVYHGRHSRICCFVNSGGHRLLFCPN